MYCLFGELLMMELGASEPPKQNSALSIDYYYYLGKRFHIWYPAAFSSQQQLQGNHSQQQGKAAGIQAQLAFTQVQHTHLRWPHC